MAVIRCYLALGKVSFTPNKLKETQASEAAVMFCFVRVRNTVGAAF